MDAIFSRVAAPSGTSRQPRRRVVQRAALVVGPSDDPSEREADAIADRVMRALDAPPSTMMPGEASVGRIRRSAEVGDAGGRLSATTQQRVHRLVQGSARALPDGVRAPMERAFGRDLAAVRVHVGRDAADISRTMSARAFTTGRDIVFGAGEYRPQTSAGRSLLAHELAHTIQQTGAPSTVSRPVRRVKTGGDSVPAERTPKRKGTRKGKAVKTAGVAIDPSDVLDRLLKVPFFQEKLDQTLRVRDDPANDSPDAWHFHVSAALQNYEQHHAGSHRTSTNQAMALAMVLQNVAKVIAFNVLYDPDLTPQVASHLLELYKPEITRQTKGMKSPRSTMKLAKALVGDDPLAMFIHHEITKQRAGARIVAMAAQARIVPEKMLTLLKERFEADLAVYTKKATALHHMSVDNVYSANESFGMVSLPYMRRLFGASFGASGPDERPAWTQDDSLAFTADTTQQFAALLAEVRQPTQVVPLAALIPGTSAEQNRHLEAVGARDQAHPGHDDQAVAAAIHQLYGGNISLTTAEKLRAKVKGRIGQMPLTISVSGENWFGGGVPQVGTTQYRSHAARGKEITFEDALGTSKRDATSGQDRTITHLGKWVQGPNDAQDRSAFYNRFRYWKDFVGMTKGAELGVADAPLFAAANLNWAATSSRTPADTANEKFAVNAYGNTHFVLKPASVAGRVLFTAECEGTPHRDPYLAFVDALMGVANIKGENKVYEDIALHIINSVTVNEPVVSRTQYFEVQIFGTIDVATDVREIVTAPSLSATAQANVAAFCNANHITCTVAARPVAGIQTSDWMKSHDALNAVKMWLGSNV